MTVQQMADKEFVRAHWVTPGIFRSHGSGDWHIMNMFPGTQSLTPGKNYRTRKMAWAAAAAFTREWLEQIAEIEEEIATLQSLHVPLDKIAPLIRCGRRGESALADLKRGMKP